MYKPFQILSDGREVAILMDDAAYTLKDPYMHSFSISYSHYQPHSGNINLDINCRTIISASSKDFLLGFDVFNHKTIRELLELVNRKIEQRR